MVPERHALLKAIPEGVLQTSLVWVTPLEILCKQEIIETDGPFRTRNDPRGLNVLFESPVISYYDGFGPQSSLNGPHSDPLGV